MGKANHAGSARNAACNISIQRHTIKILEGNTVIEKFPYVIGQPAEIFHNSEWKKGKIVAGYRFQDGVVTIRTEGGETVWCGEARKDLYRPLEN